MNNRYIGTKTVFAEPMTRAAYNALRGWALPADENGDDVGYLVEYEAGGAPNVPGYENYVSWTPKEQFDAAYQPRPLVKGLAPHQQRVADEWADLNSRLTKLDMFLRTQIFEGLDPAERERLTQQQGIMHALASVLLQRIGAFNL